MWKILNLEIIIISQFILHCATLIWSVGEQGEKPIACHVVILYVKSFIIYVS